MDAPPFPTAPDQMSASWLESRTGFELERIEVLQIGEGSGFAGSVYRIRLSHRNHASDLPESVIWKTTSGHRPTHFLLRRLGAYRAEAGFYSEMAGAVGLAPKNYFAGHDPTSGSICIIMEDLSGLRPGDQIAGCSEEESFAVVVELARLHSRLLGTTGRIGGRLGPVVRRGRALLPAASLAGLVETFKRGGDRSSEALGCGVWNDGFRTLR